MGAGAPDPGGDDGGIAVVSSRIAYENRWTRVREDVIRRPDGSPGLYGVVERTDFVVVVPFEAGRLTLVQQHRYPVRARLWEFPMGMWETRPGTAPEVLAAAELAEETGLLAAHMRYGGWMFQGAGYCSQRGHVFLATGLTQGETAREATEADMLCRAMPLVQVEGMMRDGGVVDAMSLAAFGLLRLKGWI